ncbi:MAG: Flp pilus assembly protein CpaB [Pseudomonadota bacterium]
MFIIGIAVAGGGAFYAYKLFSTYEAALARKTEDRIETVKVIVARVDIPFGHVLQGTEVTWAEWPKNSVPAGAFTDAEKLFGLRNEPRTVIQAMRTGEAVLSSKVTKLGEAPRMAYNLAEGMRAFSFPINASTGVAGFVQAGDRVDILITRKVNDQMRSEIFMQDILVIAVDQRANAESRSSARVGRIATVQVTPLDAQKLAIAQTEGTLSMTLRGIGESIQNPDEMVPINADELFDREVEVVEEQEVQRTRVKVRRGVEENEVEFEN